jgi:hypothetical protein
MLKYNDVCRFGQHHLLRNTHHKQFGEPNMGEGGGGGVKDK